MVSCSTQNSSAPRAYARGIFGPSPVAMPQASIAAFNWSAVAMGSRPSRRPRGPPTFQDEELPGTPLCVATQPGKLKL
jgi:hypothetical protein